MGMTMSQKILAAHAGLEEVKAGQLINAKLDIVRSYMRDSFNIDIDVLRATILRRQKDVFSGQVDLHSIEIK